MIEMYCNKCKNKLEIQDEELLNYNPKYDNEDGSLLPYQQTVCWVCGKKMKGKK